MWHPKCSEKGPVEAFFRTDRREGHEGLLFASRLALCVSLWALRPGGSLPVQSSIPRSRLHREQAALGTSPSVPGSAGPPTRFNVSTAPSPHRLYLARHLSHLICNWMPYGPLPTLNWKHTMLGELFCLYVHLCTYRHPVNLYGGLYIPWLRTHFLL